MSYLIFNMNRTDNTVITTNEEIASKLGISYKTVSEALQTFEKAKFIKRRRGAIMISPIILMRGEESRGHTLLRKFQSFDNRKGEISSIEELYLHPIVNQTSEILLLGSYPSLEDFQADEYYNDPKDFFWKLLYSYQGEEYDNSIDYLSKIDFLERHNYALWHIQKVQTDVNRPQTLSNPTTKYIFNDIKDFIEQNPHIKKVIVNGKETYKSWKIYTEKNYLNMSPMVFPNSNGFRGRGKAFYDQHKAEWHSSLTNLENQIYRQHYSHQETFYNREENDFIN